MRDLPRIKSNSHAHNRNGNNPNEGRKNNTERITDNYAKYCYFRMAKAFEFLSGPHSQSGRAET